MAQRLQPGRLRATIPAVVLSASEGSGAVGALSTRSFARAQDDEPVGRRMPPVTVNLNSPRVHDTALAGPHSFAWLMIRLTKRKAGSRRQQDEEVPCSTSAARPAR